MDDYVDEYYDFSSPSGDTGWDDYLGQTLPTFQNTDLSDYLSGLDSQAVFGKSGELVFTNPDGTKVTYTPEGLVRTEDPSGRNVFYHTTDGRSYTVDYSSLTPGELVEIFGQDVTGGPTRYSAFHGLGKNAYNVDYSDVFGPGGGKITTTGGDGRTVTYEGGKVTEDGKTVGPGRSLADLLKDPRFLAALAGGIAGVANRPKGGMPKIGYQGGIPKYTAVRGTPRSPTEGGRRPGGAGIGSLTGGIRYELAKDQPATGGGVLDQVEPQVSLASGGRAARYLAGGTDGMADKIQTDIDGKQPARLSHGEFVIPADVVSHLGNGNSDAGAKVLYKMMAKVRKARTGNPKQGKQIDPNKFTGTEG